MGTLHQCTSLRSSSGLIPEIPSLLTLRTRIDTMSHRRRDFSNNQTHYSKRAIQSTGIVPLLLLIRYCQCIHLLNSRANRYIRGPFTSRTTANTHTVKLQHPCLVTYCTDLSVCLLVLPDSHTADPETATKPASSIHDTLQQCDRLVIKQHRQNMMSL